MPDATRPRSDGDERAPLVGNWLSRIDERLHAAGGVLLCLDFDGTLAHIAEDPTAVEPTAECRAALETLTERSDVRVAVISGRALSDVRDRVGLEGVYYAGNHGLELDETGDTVVHPVAEKHRSTVRAVCEALSDRLADEAGCHVEDKGVTATVHHRLAPDDRTARIRALVQSTVEEVGEGALQLTPAKAAIELRPPLDWGKGHAVETFRDRVPDDYLPMYVGDDSTDESAFEAVAADGIGVHVGDGRDTAATCRVPDPRGVATFLEWLATRA